MVVAVLSGTLGVTSLNFVANASETEVSGIIDADTTWTLSGSPYVIVNPIQILYGATLTIEPGVVINNNSIPIQVGGKLNVIGTSDSKIIFNNVKISGIGTNSEHFEINMQFVELNSGSFIKLVRLTTRSVIKRSRTSPRTAHAPGTFALSSRS